MLNSYVTSIIPTRKKDNRSRDLNYDFHT